MQPLFRRREGGRQDGAPQFGREEGEGPSLNMEGLKTNREQFFRTTHPSPGPSAAFQERDVAPNRPFFQGMHKAGSDFWEQGTYSQAPGSSSQPPAFGGILSSRSLPSPDMLRGRDSAGLRLGNRENYRVQVDSFRLEQVQGTQEGASLRENPATSGRGTTTWREESGSSRQFDKHRHEFSEGRGSGGSARGSGFRGGRGFGRGGRGAEQHREEKRLEGFGEEGSSSRTGRGSEFGGRGFGRMGSMRGGRAGGERALMIPNTAGVRFGRGIDSREVREDGILGPGARMSKKSGSSYRASTASDKDGAAERIGTGDPMVPERVQEIKEKLATGQVECMICTDIVGRAAPCWSCGSCFTIFHLHCIRKWAMTPSAAVSSGPQTDGAAPSWGCPVCRSAQLVQANDIHYRCYCGRVGDPDYNEYFTPHSCGEICGKPLDRTGEGLCPHHCTLRCHPGPCSHCTASALPQSCHCGKKQFVRRCAERLKVGLSCDQPCGRLLGCGLHTCTQTCHSGPCVDCRVLVPTRCYCGKKSEVMMCGQIGQSMVADDIVQGAFSCGVICGKDLTCGNHKCQKVCHDGPCSECQLLPENVSTCPCGKVSLSVLLPPEKERRSCLDPVATCSQICKKELPCGLHECKMPCHRGPCRPCTVMVEQRCRCGDFSRNAPCSHVFGANGTDARPSAATVEKGLFLCEKKCGKKKSCGRHRCNNRCCSVGRDGANEMLEVDPHLCLLPCGKKLQCGQHSCQELCHAGHCPPCLNSVFSELSCACGATTVAPPLPCGTPPPSCLRDCSVRQPCGHPSTHLCHFGPCPPCTVPIAKSCTGGHVVLRGVPCGSRDIKCNNRCGVLRKCGQHFCNKLCHLPPCDSPRPEGAEERSAGDNSSSCGQPCGAQRRDCLHNCTALCHPGSPCPDLRCQVQVMIMCPCNRISAKVPCDVGGGKEADSWMVLASLPTPLQPVEERIRVPLGQRQLSCDEECVKMEKKRVLAEAFQPLGATFDGLDVASGSSSADLSELARREPLWVAGVEARLGALIVGSPKGMLGNAKFRVHVFSPMPSSKRAAIHALACLWSMRSTSVGNEPRRMVVVYTTTKSRPPPRTISKCLVALPGHSAPPPPSFNGELDLDPSTVVALLDLPMEAKVSNQLLRFGGECELVWLDDKNALVIFDSPGRAATALRYLDHGSTYRGATTWEGRPTVRGRGGRRSAEAGNEAENAWADDQGKGNAISDAIPSGAWRRGGPPISSTGNTFLALELATEEGTSEVKSVEEARRTGGGENHTQAVNKERKQEEVTSQHAVAPVEDTEEWEQLAE